MKAPAFKNIPIFFNLFFICSQYYGGNFIEFSTGFHSNFVILISDFLYEFLVNNHKKSECVFRFAKIRERFRKFQCKLTFYRSNYDKQVLPFVLSFSLRQKSSRDYFSGRSNI